MPRTKWITGGVATALAPQPETETAPSSPARELVDELVADGCLPEEGAKALAAIYERNAAVAKQPVTVTETPEPAPSAPVAAATPAVAAPVEPEPYVIKTPLWRLQAIEREAQRSPNVPLPAEKYQALLSAGDEEQILRALMFAGHDLHGASERLRQEMDRIARRKPKTDAELARQTEIERTAGTLRRNKSWQPPAPVAVEVPEEVTKLRAAVETASRELSEAEERAEMMKATVAKLGRDAVFDVPGAKGRTAQAAADLVKQHVVVETARATLDALKAELVAAENGTAATVRARRLAEAQALARQYTDAASRLDAALRTMNETAPALDRIVAQLEAYRDIGVSWPVSGRLLGDTRFDKAVAYAGANIQKMLGRDRVPPGSREPLRVMAERAFAVLLAATAEGEDSA